MTEAFSAGNYRYIPAVFQYSSGVAADADFEIERVRFDALLPLAEGFAKVAEHIRAAGRPLTAFCACELRSPAVVDEAGFRRFNEHYVRTLAEWGIFDGTHNPVARSNVCLEVGPPKVPSFYAFSFTRPRQNATPTFVIAGGAEARDGAGSYPERIVRYRETGPEAIRAKAQATIGSMERRLAAFGHGWNDTTAAQVYSVCDFYPAVVDDLVKRGAARSGLTWHFARPPVVDLDFEMDCRRVAREILI
ncbi:MAG: hypothetical protein JWQ94_977 [Tardiphaga sp.]|jgi:hypothetical protein|nr:hypothetical protein [Tardiphaga sp.]